MKKPVFMFHPSMAIVAKALFDKFGTNMEEWISYKEMSWLKFPDGNPNLALPMPVKNEDVIFLASFNDQATILEQLSVLYAIPRYQARSLNVILPYFPGTMDRVDEEGQIATAKTMARLLDGIPLTKEGPAIITIFDIHSLQERFYFEKVIPDLRTSMPLIHQWIGWNYAGRFDRKTVDPSKIAIVYPDDGAFKRFNKAFADSFPSVICNKVRLGEERIVTIKDGNPEGRTCIIVDDLIMKGGTTIECAKALRKNRAKEVVAFAPHAVCPDESWRRLTPELFDKVLITDSCAKTAEAVKNLEHFETLSLSELVLGIIGETADRR